MGDAIAPLIGMVAAVFASSGFWAYITKRSEDRKKKADQFTSAHSRLLLGLAHENIVTLGMAYKQRGYLTKDEFEDFVKYFYEPYTELGGNGLAERIHADVSRLPIR